MLRTKLLAGSSLIARMNPVCFADYDSDPEAGGGGSSSGADSGDIAGNGAQDQDYDYGDIWSSGEDYTPEQLGEIKTVMDKENDPSHTLNPDEINLILGFNPKLKPAKAAPPAAPSAPAAGASSPPKPTAGAQTPPAQPATPPAAPALDPNVAALIEVIKAEREGKPPTDAPAEPEAPKQFYGGHKPAMQVSPELRAMIFNADNPEQQGQALDHLVNSMMNQVIMDAGAAMNEMMQLMHQQLPQVIEQRQTAASTQQRFYQKYPALNKDVLKPLVGNIAKGMTEAYKKAGRNVEYNEEFFDNVAKATKTFLEKQLGYQVDLGGAPAAPAQPTQPAVAAQPAVAPQPKPNGRFFTNGASRPPAGPRPNGQSADIWDLIN